MNATITITLTLSVDDEEKRTPCERVENLLQYGTFRDAFADAGLNLIHVSVSDTSEQE
jgi:hypothetical protein